MIYVKNYYDAEDYYNIINRFFNLFVKENFLRINKYEYKNIFSDIGNNIINDLVCGKIKSDKKLFKVIREKLIYLINNNSILIDAIKQHKIYKYPYMFKSDNYKTYNDILNYDFFRLVF